MSLVRLLVPAVMSLLATTATACATPAPAPAPAPRPLVLFVHGRGQLGRDSAAMRRAWESSLREGMRALVNEPVIGDADVRLVWYGDALDPTSPVACTPAQRDSVAGSTRAAADTSILGQVAGAALDLLGTMLDATPDTSRGPLRTLAGDLRFLSDGARRCVAEARLDRAVMEARAARRPVIVVAHSLGALVSYAALHDSAHAAGARDSSIAFITVGAPFALPLVPELVLGGSGPLTIPGGVRSWTNVREVNDPFAPPLRDIAPARVREVILDDAGDEETAHDVQLYLRNPATAKVVLGAWCEAFGGGAKPKVCG